MSKAQHIMTIYKMTDIPNSIKYVATIELFSQYDSGLSNIERVIILCTPDNLIHLENIKTILIDGTLNYAPSAFKQLYTLVSFLEKICTNYIYLNA
jgi:hypothetical protein